ncbi:DUF1801 domain-containing protein [Paenibacillus sp. FSL H7-0357]|uniref:DUF1801 domain-containing protein n=1 Tax=Paenibacillus sp. FSL H7-0357 TaxID=1536774 RepID=UPI0009E0A67F
MSEHIKWKAPSFCFTGEDRITFNLHGKGFFRLVFHTGAKVQEHAVKGNLFEDLTGLLEWVAADRAIVTITDMEDVEGKQEKLAEVVAQWIKGTADGHTCGPC